MLFIIFIVCCILYINNIKIDTILGIVAIVITAFIFRIQDEQLSKLENICKQIRNIGNETKEITVTLQADSITQENIKKFFPRKGKTKAGHYKLFFM